MIHTIENNCLKIQISDAGAELCSIYDKDNNHEVLWQADPVYWKRHAPVLFPNVGRNYNDTFCVNGMSYPSKQHGFARDSVFTCISATADSVTHRLVSSETTKAVYPFDFIFEVTHSLSDRQVIVSWKISNTGDTPMYFTIGGHPAFNVPVLVGTSYTDYSLAFEGKDSLSYILLDPSNGTAVTDQIYNLPMTDSRCALKTDMFDHDALVFDSGQIEQAAILYPDGKPYVVMTCEGFPNFGIWSVPGAPFVCLEPWIGRCDDRGFEGELAEKKNINALNAGEVFKKEYSIAVFKTLSLLIGKVFYCCLKLMVMWG